MKRSIPTFALVFVLASAVRGAEPAAKQFLRYIYGGEAIELANICHPADDAWMLRGAKNAVALAALDKVKIAAKPTGIVSGTLGTDVYFVETRDGKVVPAFNLESIYASHRQLVHYFIYASLSGDQTLMARLVTNADKVQTVGPAAPPGEMGQYGSIIELMPVLRFSKPADDAKIKTVTYRVPLGNEALSLTLVKVESVWKIDTSKAVRVPLEFFFR